MLNLHHTEFGRSNFLESHTEKIEIIWLRFYYDKMQDNNEWFTWLFIVQREAPKGSLYKKRERERVEH